MSATLKLGTDGNWAAKKGSVLSYNDENNNFKPLPFNFTRNSSATRVNKEGLIEVVSNNEPRIDFKDSSEGALLLEPSRTNSITYSEDFTHSSWVKNNITVNSNAAISPDGTLNADLLNFTSSGNYIDKAGTITIGQTYTVSCYVKSAVASNQTFVIYGNANKSSGNITATSEWQRFTHTFTADITAMSSGIYSTSLNQLYVWGFQLEQGSYATSYIPTSGGVVTRSADVCNNGSNEQVINSSEGVLYYEGSVLDISTPNSWISVSENANINNNQFNLRFVSNSNLIQAVSRAGGLGQDVVLEHTLSDKTTINKIAIKYKLNDWALWVNGIEVDTETSSNAFTPNSLDVLDFDRGNNSNSFYGNTKDVRIYNTALTDQELINLTTI